MVKRALEEVRQFGEKLEEVRQLGEKIGYGELMSLASILWRQNWKIKDCRIQKHSMQHVYLI